MVRQCESCKKNFISHRRKRVEKYCSYYCFTQSRIGLKHTGEHKEKIRRTLRETWSKRIKKFNEYFCLICKKGFFAYPSNGRKMCSWECNKEYRKKYFRHTEEHKRNMSKIMEGRNNWSKGRKLPRWQIEKSIRNRDYSKISDTDIEKIVEERLTENNIFYESQKKLLNLTLVDFFLPKYNLAIYCDGDYWHNLPGRKEKDKMINQKLENIGFKVLRFWGKEIKETDGKCVINSLLRPSETLINDSKVWNMGESELYRNIQR